MGVGSVKSSEGGTKIIPIYLKKHHSMIMMNEKK
jgi:hypothetical protein